jgi:hypothetical protein
MYALIIFVYFAKSTTGRVTYDMHYLAQYRYGECGLGASPFRILEGAWTLSIQKHCFLADSLTDS